jgi:transposase
LENAAQLVIQFPEDISHCDSYVRGFHDVFGPVYDSIFKNTGLKEKGNRMLKDLSIMRIICPKSKRFTSKIAQEYNCNLTLDGIYKLMDRIDSQVIDNIGSLSFKNTKTLLKSEKEDLEVLFYDMTTLYFEVNSNDELRDFGFSKDGKHAHVQIMMAIITTKSGLPLGYELFPGNSYEGHTLVPVLKKLQEKYKIKKVIVVADSGLISKDNVKEISKMGLEYILGGRVKNGSKALKTAVFDEDGYTELTPTLKGKIYYPQKKKKKKTEPCANVQDDPKDAAKEATKENPEKDEEDILDPIYIYHCQNRAHKDQHEREKQVEKVRENIGKPAKSKLSGIYKKSFVTTGEDKSVIGIDEEALALMARFDGFFTLETNLKDPPMLDILNYYRALWQIEQTFRLIKYNIALRPIFHYNTDRIKAHFAMCYIALVLIRTVEYKTMQNGCYLPLEQLNESLKKVRIMRLTIKEKNYAIAQNFPQNLIPIYKALKIKPPNRFLSL